jgi:hypothetical protein
LALTTPEPPTNFNNIFRGRLHTEVIRYRFGKPECFMRLVAFLNASVYRKKIANTEYADKETGICLREHSQNVSSHIYLKVNQIINNPETESDYKILGLIKHQTRKAPKEHIKI